MFTRRSIHQNAATPSDDWSMSWRTVMGTGQGRMGRARQFAVQQVKAEIYLLSYVAAGGEAFSVNLDFASRRFVGFQIGAGEHAAFKGTFRPL